MVSVLRGSWLGWLAGVGLLVAACRGEGPSPAAPSGAPRDEPSGGEASGTVVARVGRRAITAKEVTEAARRFGWSPREALGRLVTRELLAEEAWRRGYGQRPAAARARRQVSVQRLLQREVEQVEPSISDAELRAAFERRKASLARPEMRFVAYVTFRPGGFETDEPDGGAAPADGGVARGSRAASPKAWEAARRQAEVFLERLRAAEEPVAELVEAWDRLRRRLGEAKVRFERLPPVTREARLLPEFLEAVFDLEAPGVVPRLVRTDFGWHVVVVERIEPAREAELAAVADVLRGEILAARRRRRLDALVERLRKRYGVAPSPRRDELLERLAESGDVPAEAP